MFRSKTVFILGAGASAEAGLPIGGKLTSDIAKLVNIHADRISGGPTRGDFDIYQALTRLSRSGEWEANKFLHSGREIAEAMVLASSIDTFLETHATNREYVMLGKLGIAKAISEAERSSHLAAPKPGTEFNMQKLASTWYFSLARQLFSGVPAEEPRRAFENVSFISFNYDRCLEVFLARALQVYFRIKPGNVDAIMRDLRIIHPYGSLGPVFAADRRNVPFGNFGDDLVSTAQRIRTFSESVDEPELRDKLHEMMLEAETVIFLGFAFHDQNMKLIDPGSRRRADTRIYATAYEMSESDQQVVATQLSYLFRRAPPTVTTEWMTSMHPGTCQSLFSSYWRSLTAPPEG